MRKLATSSQECTFLFTFVLLFLIRATKNYMKPTQTLVQHLQEGFQTLFDVRLDQEQLNLQDTRKEFEGHYTFVTFPFGRHTKKKPQETAELLGEYLKTHCPEVADFNVVKGFLNIVLKESLWVSVLQEISQNEHFGQHPETGRKVLIEYSSPNTNKPLHLGHLRNNFLGQSVSDILEASGDKVLKTNLVNDRGIHICKSMLMYQKYGQETTPEAENKKGDQLIGDFYVEFDRRNKAQAEELGIDPNNTPLMEEAREMLRQWEQRDPEVYALWEKLNGWVLEGHNETYRTIGVSFDKFYFESDTYLLGKDIVQEGLQKGVFFQKEDGSVWADLSEDGLDQKLLLRADGTSVYMTQDMGTADRKYEDFPMDVSVYVVGNEQDYHFKVLQLIMKKLGRSYADGIFHLSYGMVELPSGKMKTREGTVVDADQLIEDMTRIARERTQELGKIDDFSREEAEALYKKLALGAVKYYLLRVEPRKNMLFNPEESIDFQGNSGVYIQYTHAKARAIVRKAEAGNMPFAPQDYAEKQSLEAAEWELIKLLSEFPDFVKEAAANFAPSVLANYAYELARAYSRLWADLPIFGQTQEAPDRALRVALSDQTSRVLRLATGLLGMEMPERM